MKEYIEYTRGLELQEDTLKEGFLYLYKEIASSSWKNAVITAGTDSYGKYLSIELRKTLPSREHAEEMFMLHAKHQTWDKLFEWLNQYGFKMYEHPDNSMQVKISQAASFISGLLTGEEDTP